MEVARLVNDEENGYIQSPKGEHWIHTLPTWLIAVRERLLEFICD